MTVGSTLDAGARVEIDQARVAWIRDRLASISFQHWVFELRDTGPDTEPLVFLSFATTDSTNPTQPFTAEQAWRMDDLPTTVEAFGWWALAAVSAAQLHEIAEQLMINGMPVFNPHSPEYRQWDGALYRRLSDVARANGNAYHGVLFAAGAELVAANAIPPEISLGRNCRDHLVRNVVPRQVLTGTRAA